MNSLKKYLVLFVVLITVGSINAKELPDQEKKATEWIKTLELNDKAKEKRLIKIVTKHLTAVKEWHDSHPASMVPPGINPRTGDKLTDLDRQIIVDSSMPSTVHENLMDGLREELTKEQVEKVLDCYTVGKVAFTMKAYKEIVTDMTPKEEEVILGNLKKAREMAVDFKSMKEISAIFEIYKTKNEQYLNNNGRNWHQMYKNYVKALKEKKNKK